MMKTILLGAMLLTGGLMLVPQASAACEPLTDPSYCTGTIRPTVDRVLDAVDRIVPDGLPECWYYPDTGDIRCEWEA